MGGIVLQGLILVLALCIDAFVAAAAYGAEQMKIPLRSAAAIGAVGTGVLGCSLLLSAVVQSIVPPQICTYASFFLLLFLGISSLFQNGFKAYLRSKSDFTKKLKFRLADISFFIRIYLDETEADADRSKVLSVREALCLGVALSVDSLVTGLASGLAVWQIPAVLVFCFAAHIAAVVLGAFAGGRLSAHSRIDLSWVGGLLLILLALVKLFSF